jgi:hypothetical protein
MFRRVVLVVIVVVALPFPCVAETYEGSLSLELGQIEVVGPWADSNPVWERIDWTVSREDSGPFLYEYTLWTDIPSPSHWLMEVSPPDPATNDDGFQVSYPDFFNINTNTPVEETYVDLFSVFEADDLYALKWDSIEDMEPVGDVYELYFSFNSWRAPVWGDFHVKAGGNDKLTEFWNEGFSRDDPLAAPQDGTIDNHILRPNGDVTVPAPATMILIPITLGGVALWRRRRD